MRRAALLAAIAGLALAGALALVALPARSRVPVLRLVPRDFVHSVSAEGELRTVQATPVAAPVDVADSFKVAWAADDGARVAAGEVVVRFDPTDLEKDLAAARAELATVAQRIQRCLAERAAAIETLQRDAEQAGRELEYARTFQSTDEEIYSRFEIVSSAIDASLAGDRQRHADLSRSTRAEISAGELGLLEIDRRKAEMQIARAEKGLAALEVRAPHEGFVVLVRDWRGELVARAGSNVWNGQKLAEIPSPGAMEAEVFVLEADANGLAAGASATIEIDGRPDTSLKASVARVDAIAKPRSRGVPVQYFAAVLSVADGQDLDAKPGQRVHATIEIARRADALVVPRQAVLDRDGTPTVHRRRRWGSFEPVAVVLGPASLGRVVVDEGLAAGDVIALLDPTAGPAPREAATPAMPAPAGRS